MRYTYMGNALQDRCLSERQRVALAEDLDGNRSPSVGVLGSIDCAVGAAPEFFVEVVGVGCLRTCTGRWHAIQSKRIHKRQCIFDLRMEFLEITLMEERCVRVSIGNLKLNRESRKENGHLVTRMKTSPAAFESLPFVQGRLDICAAVRKIFEHDRATMVL